MSPPPPKKQICASLQQQSPTSPTKVVSIHSRSKSSNDSSPRSPHGAHSSSSPRVSPKSEPELDQKSSPSSSPTVHKSPRSLYDRRKSSESKDVRIYEPISPASSDHEDSKDGASQLRCDYVKVIVSSKEAVKDQKTLAFDAGPMRSSPTPPSNFLTLKIERIFTDSYLRQAWEKCQYIDLFLYSCQATTTTDQVPHLQPLIPAHRILLSAYSDYVRQFLESYPEPVKFVEHLQTFLKEVVSSSSSSSDGPVKRARAEDKKDVHALNLKALGLSTIPVLALTIPLADLHDLVKLMYQGEIRVDKSRIGSLQQSAHVLKMSQITIVETGHQIIDSAGQLVPLNASQSQCNHNCDCGCNQNPTEAEKPNCDLESIISTSQSGSSSSQDGSSISANGETSPPVILVDDNDDQLAVTPTKRSFAAFLRDSTATPTLSIPKFNKPDTVLRNAFEKPKLMHSNLMHSLMAHHGSPFDGHPLLGQSKQFSHQLITRSQSLNEMDRHRIHRSTLPESPLTGQKPNSEVPVPPTPAITNPFANFNQLLPANLLTPPIDSPIDSMVKPMLPQSPKLTLPSVLHTPPTSGLSPFLFSKNPFEGFHQSFPFSGLGSSGGGGGGPGITTFQRQFSAPANLQASSFTHPPPSHDLSPLIFDGHIAASGSNSHPPEIAKSRRGRKPANYMPPSEPTSPSVGMFGDTNGLFGGSDRSESPKSDSHACGANGWATTAGSGANCRKRCQNLYHAAKYRDRRRQRMEQLYNEKDALEKTQSLYLSKISSLKMQICSLITQRTQHQSGNGSITYRCPVCRAVYFDVESIRSHLTNEHHEDFNNKVNANATTAAVAAAAAVAATAAGGGMDPVDIAAQIRSLTKDWLVRNGNGEPSSPGISVGPSSSKSLFGGPLAASALAALPMIPFN